MRALKQKRWQNGKERTEGYGFSNMGRLKNNQPRGHALEGFKLFYEELVKREKTATKPESKKQVMDSLRSSRPSFLYTIYDRFTRLLWRIDDKLFVLVFGQDERTPVNTTKRKKKA